MTGKTSFSNIRKACHAVARELRKRREFGYVKVFAFKRNQKDFRPDHLLVVSSSKPIKRENENYLRALFLNHLTLRKISLGESQLEAHAQHSYEPMRRYSHLQHHWTWSIREK